MPTGAIATSASKEDLSSHQVAVKFFNKQAKLKPVKLTDDEYSEHLYPKKDEKKSLWGYVNDKDKWVIKPVFDEVGDFGNDNYALVKLSGYWGMIDRTRSFVIVPINNKIEQTSLPNVYVTECPRPLWNEYDSQSYEKIREEILQTAKSLKIKVHAIWRQDGTLLSDSVFNTFKDFDENGLSVVSTASGFGLIDDRGTFVVEPKYSGIELFGNSLYQIEDDQKFGLANHEGKTVLPMIYDVIEKWNLTDLIWIRHANNKKWNAIDSNGNVVVNCNLDDKPAWNDRSLSIVTSEGKYGILEKNGTFVVECDDEYIEKDGTDYWVIKIGNHVGKYRLLDNRMQYVEMPRFKSPQTDKKLLLKEYKRRYNIVVDDRLWLKGLHEATFYTPFEEDESVSFPFQILGHDYVLQPIWEDTVHFVLKSLAQNYRLPFVRKVGYFDIDNHGHKGEMFTNEYVMGTYDIDSDGIDELIIALRDNTTSISSKPSGGCYCAYKINSNGQCRFVKSDMFSDKPVARAQFIGKNLKVDEPQAKVSIVYPCAKNFGLKGPVMTTGDSSFDVNGQLTKIGGYIIRYNQDNVPSLPDSKGDDHSMSVNHRLTQFNQRGIIVEFDYDCMGDGKYENLGSESWTFNNQGLLETFEPFSCNGGCQMYYVYNPSGILLYEIEEQAAWTVTRYLSNTAVFDEFGNWTSMKALVYDENGVYETVKNRIIEYYTESESGK